VRFGITFANAGPWALPEFAEVLARTAEELGFESLWTVEHVVVPEGYGSQYPYSRSGRMPGPEEAPIPDPLVWLAWVAARTSTIRLATGILILPQRNPVILAKEVATLDVLSGGRVILGVGVGWLEEEFDIIGVPFEGRGARTDEAIAALRALWTQDAAEHHGEAFDFAGAKSYPHPMQRGGVPIVVGGHSPAAARRAGRLGDGFFPARGDPDELRSLVAEMRTAAEAAGRDPDAIEITFGGANDLEWARTLAALGASRLTIAPPAFDPVGLRAGLEAFASEVMDPLGT
jgi:probable F420-dependent oxidoreductase